MIIVTTILLTNIIYNILLGKLPQLRKIRSPLKVVQEQNKE